MADFFNRSVYAAITLAVRPRRRRSARFTHRPSRTASAMLGIALLSTGVGDVIYSLAPSLDAVPAVAV